jgi:5,10-methylenetetrahydromethanopterin reductase
MQRLTGGRFILGIGRGYAPTWRSWGMAPPTIASLADFASIVRRLWAGERVSYDGPAGRYPELELQDRDDGAPPPIVLGAMGPKTLALAGRAFDGALLSPYLTVEAVRERCQLVRAAAERAERDPALVKVYAPVVVGAALDPEVEEAKIAARAVTYFQIPGLGDMLVDANGFDRRELESLRGHPQLTALAGGLADAAFHRDELLEVSRLVPRSWIERSAAVGTDTDCVSRLREYLDTGVDGLVLHATSPRELTGVASGWRSRVGSGS